MSKRQSGLQQDKKTGEWSIDKRIKGYGRVRQRLQASSQEEAEMMFFKVIAEIQSRVKQNNACVMTFREAGVRYVGESNHRSIGRDIVSLELVDQYIGDLPLSNVHIGTLQSFIDDRHKAGILGGTITRDLATVKSVLSLAARSWRNNNGQPYLIASPVIEIPDWKDSKSPYPLDWQQQRTLLTRLPKHLKVMSLFALNTGLREQGVCWLRWDWEVRIPELNISIFITPGRQKDYGQEGVWLGEKNDEDQIVVLNLVAKKVIDIQRAKRTDNCPWVFPYRNKRISRIHNTAWKNAWKKAKLTTDKEHLKGPHNLKHTFGRSLRQAGVNLETRKTLLHHTHGDVTLDYSPAEVQELLEATQKIVGQKTSQILRRDN